MHRIKQFTSMSDKSLNTLLILTIHHSIHVCYLQSSFPPCDIRQGSCLQLAAHVCVSGFVPWPKIVQYSESSLSLSFFDPQSKYDNYWVPSAKRRGGHNGGGNNKTSSTPRRPHRRSRCGRAGKHKKEQEQCPRRLEAGTSEESMKQR